MKSPFISRSGNEWKNSDVSEVALTEFEEKREVLMKIFIPQLFYWAKIISKINIITGKNAQIICSNEKDYDKKVNH